MTLTIWARVWTIVVACAGGLIGIGLLISEDGSKRFGIATLICTAITVIIMLFAFNWYYTSYAPGIRAYKTDTSARENGLYREIIITAENGREIYYFKGKVDIETDPEKNYIMFEDEDNIRHIICYGITDTIMITELHE